MNLAPRNTLTKDGFTGNSGLGVDTFAGVLFHIAANYVAGSARRGKSAGKPMCFVESYERQPDGTIEPVPSWKRMTVARAKREKRVIIPCALCKKPAISLCHYWPWNGNDMNYCADHRKVVQSAEYRRNLP